MFSLSWVLFAMLLLAAAQSAAKEPAYYDSLRLVSAMREDERMLREARVEKLRQTKLSGHDIECIDRFEYPEVTDVAAKLISDTMSDAEVQDALGYFQSPSGGKLVRRELGLAGEVPFTMADQVDLEKFRQRPAGRKLFRDLILRNSVASMEVMARLDRHLLDCAFLRQNDAEREIPRKSCQARPVASSDNICLATYGAEGSGRKPQRANVEVNCRKDGRVLTSRISLPKPDEAIGLRWSDYRDLEILVDGKIKNVSPQEISSVKVTFASRQQNDPPLLECVPQTRGHLTLAETLPPNVTVGAWRAYSRPGLCLMTTRVPKEDIAGADGDVLLQFRRQKPAVPPFATTDLALVVEIDQQSEESLLVDFGQKRLTLIAQPPQQRHMLTGMTTDVMLQGLRSRPLELTVRRAGEPNFSIPLRRQDFDFAYAEFNECLAALAST